MTEWQKVRDRVRAEQQTITRMLLAAASRPVPAGTDRTEEE